MHFPRHRHRPNEDERILPLTNVIFLLLIFFMLVGHLSSTDTLAIQPPHSVSDTAAERNGLLIQVNADGAIALDGTPIRPAALKMAVHAYLQSHPNGTGIRLKADGLVDAARVVAVMRVLKQAGAERLRLLTRPANG